MKKEPKNVFDGFTDQEVALLFESVVCINGAKKRFSMNEVKVFIAILRACIQKFEIMDKEERKYLVKIAGEMRSLAEATVEADEVLVDKNEFI